MTTQQQYNLKSPAVKRLMREAMELSEPTDEYYAWPLEDNLFEWHFTVKGPVDTEFEGGLYHGRILLPTEYPMQPPNIVLLTPNGRFEINKKICLSISGYHPETWQPSWSIRTALLALIAFMPTPAGGALGALDYTPEERKVLARKSQNYECSLCGSIKNNLSSQKGNVLSAEESNLIKQIALKGEEINKTQEKGEESETSDYQEAESVASDAPDTDGLRQRIAESESASSLEADVEVQDSILQASIRSSNRDKIWSTVIWAIISTITLLIIRRIFFV